MKKYIIENNISELFKVAAIISAIIGGIKNIDELHKDDGNRFMGDK